MNNLLISLIIAVATIGTASKASADRTFEVKDDVVKLVIKKTEFVFAKPTTILIKTCIGDARYECVYKLSGKRRNKEIKIYEYRADDYVFPIYVTEHKLASN
jgi:hypothetical protein